MTKQTKKQLPEQKQRQTVIDQLKASVGATTKQPKPATKQMSRMVTLAAVAREL